MKTLFGLLVCALALTACSSKNSPSGPNKYNASERKVMRTHAIDAPPPMLVAQ